MPPDVTSAREHLLSALEADLVGPYEKPRGLDLSDELLKLRLRADPDFTGGRGLGELPQLPLQAEPLEHSFGQDTAVLRRHRPQLGPPKSADLRDEATAALGHRGDQRRR
jgi:hypothetical protein